jgi:DNA-binding NtrC family response regulator
MQDKILIVDDDELVLDCFARLLARDFNVETAVGPYAALDAIRSRGPFAVVMSDLRMPGMNGLELLESAKALSPEIVGIVVSGNIEWEDASSPAVYKVLDKPCSPDVMVDTLNNALSHHRRLCGIV